MLQSLLLARIHASLPRIDKILSGSTLSTFGATANIVGTHRQLQVTSVKADWLPDDARGELWAEIDGKPAFCYRYGHRVDLPHFFPIDSPAGRSMTVQQTEPYPHHRSFWFGDRGNYRLASRSMTVV